MSRTSAHALSRTAAAPRALSTRASSASSSRLGGNPEIATVYGARFGIEGVLEEDFAGSGSAHQTLRVTPAMEAGIVDADHV